MRNIIFILMVLIMSSGCSTTAQSYYTDYEEIYYDYVINGVITHPEFVNDGTYSYHIIGHYPTNVYWELIPYGDVYLFNIIVGLLPIIKIVSKTPASILARKDVD